MLRRFAVGRRRKLIWGLAILAFTIFWAVGKGTDGNWDLRNYHYWSVYAMFNGTTFDDVGPAQIQSWNNPLSLVPAYLAVTHLSPLWATLWLGALAGLNGVLLLLLTDVVVRPELRARSTWAPVFVALCGLSGPIFLSEVGTTINDVVCSLFVLSGILALYTEGTKKFVLSGLLLGAATGLKLTCAAFAIALALTLILGWRYWILSLRSYLLFVVSCILGAVITAGYWTWLLYSETGNPVFPYFNALFASPLFDTINSEDRRFLPTSLLNALAYPFLWAVGKHTSAEVPFRDLRFALLMMTVPIATLFTMSKTVGDRPRPMVAARDFQLLTLFFVLSFVIWIALWGIQRYITVLELLAGLLLFLCIDRIVPSMRMKRRVTIGLLVLCILWSQPANWGHEKGFADDFFEVSIIEGSALSGNTLYVIQADGSPISYVLPFLPDPARSVRLTGNFGSLTPKRPLGRAAKAAIDKYTGSVRSLSTHVLTDEERRQLRAFGLRMAAGPDCVRIDTRFDRFESCRLIRE
jgi:hypothetical protein